MIIDYPTLGAGRGRLGSLVAWAVGLKQVIRSNCRARPLPSTNQLAIQSDVKWASVQYANLTSERKTWLKNWASGYSITSAWQLFQKGWLLVRLNDRFDSTKVIGFKSDVDIETGAFGTFETAVPTAIDWVPKTAFSNPIDPVIVNFSYSSAFDRLTFKIESRDGVTAFDKLNNPTDDFGLFLKARLKVGKKYLWRDVFCVFNCAFSASAATHEVNVGGFSQLIANANINYLDTTVVDLRAFIVNVTNFWQTLEIDIITRS